MNRRQWATRGIAYTLCLGVIWSYATYPDREVFGHEPNPDRGPDTIELLVHEASDYNFRTLELSPDQLSAARALRPETTLTPELADFLNDLRETLPDDLRNFLTQQRIDTTAFCRDAAFCSGAAAFGSGGECPLQSSVRSTWPVETQLLVRREVDVPAGTTAVRILVSVNNDIVDVFVNGTSIADNIAHGLCPILDEFRFDVPQPLVQPGTNVVAFHVVDRGVESFFDTRILATLRGLLPKSGSEPPFEPAKWNEFAVQVENNCYNYACNKITNTYAQPGKASGMQFTAFTCMNVTSAALADGLRAIDCDQACPTGSYKKALVVDPDDDPAAPGADMDYHWYRQDRDGSWSHKPGGAEATNVDASGRRILDPRTAARTGPSGFGVNYRDFCGCFCCNPQVVKE